jgi:predicted ArsR family transcriptional regulator
VTVAFQFRSFRHKYWVSDRILRALENGKGLTRSDLVNILGEPRTTLFDHLSKLISKGQVRTTQVRVKPGPGRARTLYHLPRFDVVDYNGFKVAALQ